MTVTHKSALWTQGALNFKGLKGLNNLAQSRTQGRQPHSGTLGRKDIVSFLRGSATTVTQGAADALPWANLLPPFRRPAVRSTTVSSNKDMGHDQLEKSAAGCLDAFRDSKTTP